MNSAPQMKTVLFGRAGVTPADAREVARERGPVVRHVVKVSVCAAEREVEGRARGDAQDRGESEAAGAARQVERGGEGEAVAAVEEAAGALAAEVAGAERALFCACKCYPPLPVAATPPDAIKDCRLPGKP
jgi:hypothetical protein